MPIEVTCNCGKRLLFTDESAGSLGQCPFCGRVLQTQAPEVGLGDVTSRDVTQAMTADPVRISMPSSHANAAFSEEPLPITQTEPESNWRDNNPPAYKLWSPSAVGAVAFLCGPVGAFIMLAINFARLGNRFAAWSTAVGGALTVGVVLALAFSLPDNKPGMFIALPLFLAIWGVAHATQHKPFEAHVHAGGAAASGWSAAGIGVLGLAIFIGLVIGVSVIGDLDGIQGLGTRVEFGGGQEIYYTRGATEGDARALGAVLRKAGFFDGRNPAAVQVARDRNLMIVAFVVQPWVLKDAPVQQGFRALGQQASEKAFTGRPVEVWLCDEWFNVKKKLP